MADFFDTNLSSIDVVDTYKHLFKVEDWDGDIKSVVIYNEEEFEVIKVNFIDHFFTEISEKKVEVGSFEFELKGLIDKKTFETKLEEKMSKTQTTELVEVCLGAGWNFEGVSEGNFIWVKS